MLSSQEPLNRESPAFITYRFSGNCEGDVADLHCVTVSIELNLHQSRETPAEEGQIGNPCGY